MIEVLPESDGNLLAVRAVGKLRRSDYRDEIIPRLRAIFHDHGKARFLLEDFDGWDVGAFWDDARFGLAHRQAFERIGIIGGPRWVVLSLKIVALTMDGEVRTFSPGERGEAFEWIKG